MAQTLNWSGSPRQKKYTVLANDQTQNSMQLDRDALECVTTEPTDQSRRPETVQRSLAEITAGKIER